MEQSGTMVYKKDKGKKVAVVQKVEVEEVGANGPRNQRHCEELETEGELLRRQLQALTEELRRDKVQNQQHNQHEMVESEISIGEEYENPFAHVPRQRRGPRVLVKVQPREPDHK